MATTGKRARLRNGQPDPMDFGAAEESLSLKSWGDPPQDIDGDDRRRTIVDCGWGRILFGQTFRAAQDLAEELQKEKPGERDVVFYARDPHVLLAERPQSFFLDPSHTFRLEFTRRKKAPKPGSSAGYHIRPVAAGDQEEVNRIYLARAMVPLRDGFCAGPESGVVILVAEAQTGDGGLLGVVMGVDHHRVFQDPDNGASLWALAVDPQAPMPGIGLGLVDALADRFEGAGRSFMDLSVLHDNAEAIRLYESLNFSRVPVYCIKKKNSINEPLFIGTDPEVSLNIYAEIIVDEARRRGIEVFIEDAEAGLFNLSLGGKTVSCRESLSDMTSAVALSRCDDKALTRRLLADAGLSVPDQVSLTSTKDALRFLKRHGRIVIKPQRGEQGRGVFVELSTEAEVKTAYNMVSALSDQVIAEQFIAGDDLRIIVIDGEVVAAAIRRPAAVVGDGVHDVDHLIAKQSRRRASATGGESVIPVDDETRRCVADEGYSMDQIPTAGAVVRVRKTANLHSGGTIHDVTQDLHPALAEAVVQCAETLQIPVVGLDFIVPAHDGPDYWVIEANERPGLANHEPQPTAERFVDFLFPESVAGWRRREGAQ